jgi:hypothetical protein
MPLYEVEPAPWNRRPPKPLNGRPVDCDALDRETRRKQRLAQDLDVHSREETLRRIGEVRERESRGGTIRSKLGDIARESNEAADAHQRVAGPLQIKLKKLDGDIVSALTSAGPTEALENQRRAVLDQIEQANLALQQKCQILEGRRELLEQELASPELNCDALGTLVDRLQRFAPIESQARLEALENTRKAADARSNAAAQKVAHLRKIVERETRPAKPPENTPENLLVCFRRDAEESARVARLRLARGEAELAEANRVGAEAAKLHRLLLNEIRNT